MPVGIYLAYPWTGTQTASMLYGQACGGRRAPTENTHTRTYGNDVQNLHVRSMEDPTRMRHEHLQDDSDDTASSTPSSAPSSAHANSHDATSESEEHVSRAPAGDASAGANTEGPRETPTSRLQTTGLGTLDQILGGGLPVGTLMLIMGRPGSGKTTLANQLAFAAAREGRTALILTALSESTNKLVEHLRAFSFYDSRLVGRQLHLMSLQPLAGDGLGTMSREILRLVRDLRADLVVLDGFRGMPGVEGTTLAAREFLYQLGTSLGTFGAHFIVTSETDPTDPAFYPESTTADVVLALGYTLVGGAFQRTIEVVKARGVAPMTGQHALTLSGAGATVYPQLEARVLGASPPLLAPPDEQTTPGSERLGEPTSEGTRSLTARVERLAERAGFDLPVLDGLMRGGINRGTSALIAGSSGTGKTLLALSFILAGIRRGEPALYLGLREQLDQLLAKADAFAMGNELRDALRPEGGLTLIRLPAIQLNADIVADLLLREIDRTGARRVAVDSVFELEHAVRNSQQPQRLLDFLSALLEALHRREVTMVFTRETEKALSATLDFSGEPLSVLAENVIWLQQVVYQRDVFRVLSVLKMRLSAHDFSLREFRIAAPQGIEVFDSDGARPGLLDGIALQQGSVAPVNPGEQGHRADHGSRREAGSWTAGAEERRG